ncbi:MAG: pantoate kinase [Candidatus Helarchaeota archaeon]
MSHAFSPGHITVIFSIKDKQTDNILEQGSLGTGFSITQGVITEVEAFPSDKQIIKIYINDNLEKAPVSKSVVNHFLKMINKKMTIIVKHRINLPIGSGFGCSGAGALSASLALNAELGLNLNKEKCGQVAHIAEVKNKTGLGDVIGSFFGGFEIRVKPGAPGIGKVINLPISEEIYVVCATGGILKTKNVLSDEILRKNIISAGDHYLQQIISKKEITISKIIDMAKLFSEKTTLMTPEIKSTLNILENEGFMDSSMVMLGKSIFCLTEKNNVDKVFQILKKQLPSWSIFKTQIDYYGARLL